LQCMMGLGWAGWAAGRADRPCSVAGPPQLPPHMCCGASPSARAQVLRCIDNDTIEPDEAGMEGLKTDMDIYLVSAGGHGPGVTRALGQGPWLSMGRGAAIGAMGIGRSCMHCRGGRVLPLCRDWMGQAKVIRQPRWAPQIVASHLKLSTPPPPPQNDECEDNGLDVRDVDGMYEELADRLEAVELAAPALAASAAAHAHGGKSKVGCG
jgi:hypothetical protein